MAKRTIDISRPDVEAWIARQGIDWEAIIREAGIPADQRYIVPSRWGKNPVQMRKVVEALEKRERSRKTPTEDGERLMGLATWEKIGRDLSRVPQLFKQEIARLLPIAEGAVKIAEGEQAKASLLSPTPTPTKPRK